MLTHCWISSCKKSVKDMEDMAGVSETKRQTGVQEGLARGVGVSCKLFFSRVPGTRGWDLLIHNILKGVGTSVEVACRGGYWLALRVAE